MFDCELTDAAPEISVTAEWRDDGAVVLTVADNGVGVPAHMHDRIFRPFERDSGAASVPGSGLGLANCARVVTELGGAIWVEPNSPHGSRFRALIPSRD